MARPAIVLGVLVSSPSDVDVERATILEAIHDWNSSHSRNLGIVLEPVQWQTHAYPEAGARPQAIINKQIVDEADMVLAVFGHRIGTATGAAQSGTIEEIERLRKKGKHVAVYFSKAPIPRDHDPEQLRLLNEYRQLLKKDTLYWEFASEELYRLVSQHLARSVSALYQELQTSRTIDVLASQLPAVVNPPKPTGKEKLESQSSEEPFYLQHVVVGEFPEGPTLRLTANMKFSLTGLDYLSEHGARVSSQSDLLAHSHIAEGKGQMVEAPIDHAKLIQVHNLKPRSGSEAIPMQLRLHLRVGSREETKTMPVLLQPSFKQINGTTTYFMKLLG